MNRDFRDNGLRQPFHDRNWDSVLKSERHVSRIIYGIVLFAFLYFGMGTIIFIFFR